MNKLSLKDGREVPYRRLRSGDEAALRRFHETLSQRSKALFTPHAYDDDSLEKMVQRSEKDTDRSYVAFDDDRIVAYFFLWWFDTPFPSLGIGIAEDHQGQGLGKLLMSILLNDAKTAGCDGVELTTVLDNARAKALYEKVGFKCLGIVDNQSGDGRIVKEYHMLYLINPDASPPKRTHAPPA